MPEPSSLRYRRPSTTTARRFPIVPLVIAAVAVLGVIALAVAMATGGGEAGDEVPGLEQTQPVTVEGEGLPPHGEGTDPAVGQPAPTLEGRSFDGSPLTVGDDGRPKVLVFLAHWCPHCQAEVPRLADWLAENGLPSDVDVYAIATATDPRRPNYPPSAWLEREGFTVPTLADDEQGTAAEAFGLSSFPFFVAVDADGQVVARASGELTMEQWEDLLDQARGSTAG